MPKVFISYRRSDSISATGRIYDRLTSHFSKQDVFMDVDNIPAGVRFSDYIQGSLRECMLELVIIGREWATVSTSVGRRLDDPQDLVRQEIEVGLALGLTVLPVLVEGASMPTKANLPESLGELSEINAIKVDNDPDFSRDMERLVWVIEQVFAARTSSLSQPANEAVGAAAHVGVECWEVVASPTSNMLLCIALISASEGWAVGARGTILHYRGGQWLDWMNEPKPTRSAVPTSKDLTSVVMVSHSEGWAVGHGHVILHYDGGEWKATVSTIGDFSKRLIRNVSKYVLLDITGPNYSDFSSIARASTTDVWAVGKRSTYLGSGWPISHQSVIIVDRLGNS